MLSLKQNTWICCGWTGPRLAKGLLESIVKQRGDRKIARDIARSRAKVILELNDDIQSVRVLLTPTEARHIAEDLVEQARLCQDRKPAALSGAAAGTKTNLL